MLIRTSARSAASFAGSIILSATTYGCVATPTATQEAPPAIRSEGQASATGGPAAAVVGEAAPPTETFTQEDRTVDPSYVGLSLEQKLDRVLALPGQRGFVRGVTGNPSVATLPGSTPGFSDVVTDFPFTVQEYMGRGASPYPVGSVITLRVPGGTVGGRTTRVEDVPAIRAGQEWVVDVRDQGQIAGGNGPTRQVVSSTADAFEVRNGIVLGAGAWAGLSEPITVFRRHFGG